MSFAIAHQSNSRAADSKSSIPARDSTIHNRVKKLGTDFYPDVFINLPQTIESQTTSHSALSHLVLDFAKASILQPKLKVSQPGDEYEQEADQVADQVMRMSVSPYQIAPMASRTEVEDGKKLNIGRNPPTIFDRETPDRVTNEVNNIRSSPGSPLDAGTRKFMESRLGYDFSSVRIHTDERSARSSETINALSYTVGNDIIFGAGQYQPKKIQGMRLLAHELVHVVQQSGLDEIRIGQDNAKRGFSALQISNNSTKGIARQPGTGSGQSAQGKRGNYTALQARLLQQARERLKPEKDAIVGVLVTEDGRQFEFKSGGGQGFPSHIEGKATEKMNELGIKKATLIVEKEPCQICDRSVYPFGELDKDTPLISSHTGKEISRQTPKINSALPIGSELTVVGPDSTGIYRGTKTAPSTPKTGTVHEPPASKDKPKETVPKEPHMPKSPKAAPTPPAAKEPTMQEASKTPQSITKAPNRMDALQIQTEFKTRILRDAIKPVISIGAGFAFSWFESKVQEKMLDDLRNLPKPKIDERSASEYLLDPNTSKAIKVLDVLNKDFKIFSTSLTTAHNTAMFKVARQAMDNRSLLTSVTPSKREEGITRSGGLLESLEIYKYSLSIVKSNVNSILKLKGSLLEAKAAADNLHNMLDPKKNVAKGYLAAKLLERIGIVAYQNIVDSLLQLSVAIESCIKDAEDLLANVERLIKETNGLAGQISEQTKAIIASALVSQLGLDKQLF